MAKLISPNPRLHRKRLLKDRLARYMVGVGGVSVIFAIALIFFYFIYVVIPLFSPAEQQKVAEYPQANQETMLAMSMEEQAEIAVSFSKKGNIRFWSTVNGQEISQFKVQVPEKATVSSFSMTDASRSSAMFGFSNGQILATRLIYKTTYPNDKRLITPGIDAPLGEEPLRIDEMGFALTHLAYQDGDEEATVVAQTADKRLLMMHIAKQSSFLDEGVTLTKTISTLQMPGHAVDFILIDKNQHHLFLISRSGALSLYDIKDKTTIHKVQEIRLVSEGVKVTVSRFLTGDLSILAGDSQGNISQWSMVPNEHHESRLKRIRIFSGHFQGEITDIASEQGRKGFVASDDKGYVGIFHTTAHRNLLLKKLSDKPIGTIAIAPRANAMMVADKGGRLQFVHIDNEHPEVSWKALWGKVWYESYAKPEYIWQSSSSSDDFEPKYSLTPIAFGTLKAAFYAMLIAIPLSIFGALYTAQFMRPGMRKLVKPSIEIMEALPTVILGFLAGLWLAPFIEMNLPGIFAMLIVLPVGILLASYGWQKMPARVRHKVPEGWEAALLLPVVALILWLSFALSPVMEGWWFGNDMRAWLTNQIGIGFDQRNAIVVGLAMGFAVIPTIFSIAEDAIFGVPKHLSNGSLAMGATSWQTLVRIVLPSASPGIFSGIMIGLGRAVGETMIVLMATGNTPIMDFSPFEGLRTLSANIAVELPEAELDGTHYRVLFLAGLVLFMFTFVVNTIAEIIRQRLRQKYSNL